MRYARQEILIGKRAQKTLKKSLVTVAGCGGTGSIAAEYLARAGVNLRLIDRDIVEQSNLGRQLFTEDDIGKPKASALAEHLKRANSEIRIQSINDDLNQENIYDYLTDSSVVVDGTDNMLTRFLINDFCMKKRIPFTYAAALKSEGLFTLMIPKKTPCLQCFVPVSSINRLDTCETAGVIGPVVGVIGSISAAEVINFLSGRRTIAGSMFHFNSDKKMFQTIELNRRKDCKSCSGIYEFLDTPSRQVTRLCGNAYQHIFDKEINLHIIAGAIEKTGEFKVLLRDRNFLKLKYKDQTISLFRNRMIVQNIYSERAVRTIASKLVG